MEVLNTKKEDCLVLDFVGQLNTGTAQKVELEVNKFLDNHSKIIFNLEQTAFVSSAGLRVFLATAKKMKASGGKFRICTPNAVVQEILDISGFSTILDIKPSLEEALKDF